MEEEKKSFLRNIFDALIEPGKKIVRGTGSGLEQVFKTGQDIASTASGLASGKVKVDNQGRFVDTQTGQQLTQRSDQEKFRKSNEELLKGTAGVASYAIPAGKGVKLAQKLKSSATAGAKAGGLMGLSMTQEDKPEDQLFDVAKGALGGAAVSGAVQATGSALGGITSWIARSVKDSATKNLVKTTPAQYTKIVEESGKNINDLARKYIPQNAGWDDLVGPVKAKGKGGLFGERIKAAEEVIKSTVDTLGKNFRISGDDLIKELRSQAKIIKSELSGSDARSKAIDNVRKQTALKYKKGLTAKQAVDTLREANAKFGAAILEDSGDAIATASQKMEGNFLRNVLKKTFPDIAAALDEQSDLIILRGVINRARSTGETLGSELRVGRISNINPLNPLSWGGAVDSVMQNPKVASTVQSAQNPLSGILPQGTPEYIVRQSGMLATPQTEGQTEPLQTPVESSEETVTIKNKRTGERRVVKKSELSNYGVSDGGRRFSNEQLEKAYESALMAGDKAVAAQAKELLDYYAKKDADKTKLTAAQKTALAKLGDAENLLTSFETQLQGIGLSESGPQQRIEGSLRSLGASLGFDEQVKVYNDLRDGLRSQLAKALGQAGSLSDQDIKYAVSLIPAVTDSAGEARRKLELMRGIIASNKESVNNNAGGQQAPVMENVFAQ